MIKWLLVTNNCFSVCCRKIGKDVFVELDVGSDNNSNEPQIRGVLYAVVKEGTIASYDTSVVGFQFRRLGECKSITVFCAFGQTLERVLILGV